MGGGITRISLVTHMFIESKIKINSLKETEGIEKSKQLTPGKRRESTIRSLALKCLASAFANVS